MNQELSHAIQIQKIYFPGCSFRDWVIEPSQWKNHSFSDTVVFYHKEDSFEDVKRLCLEREPCNIGMRRLYNKVALKSEFGWEKGAYAQNMPNIAIYCNATVKSEMGSLKVNVLNLIGCALDTPEQPDFKVYNTKEKVLGFYEEMWKLALGAMKQLGKKKFQIYNVGGGAFSGPYGMSFIEEIFEPSFLPLLPEFEAAGIEVLGFDRNTHRFTGGFIPECLNEPTQDLENTVYVNAWDPWSLIGNGNERDGSLDGYWGRCSNMSVLGWLKTNPSMRFISV